MQGGSRLPLTLLGRGEQMVYTICSRVLPPIVGMTRVLSAQPMPSTASGIATAQLSAWGITLNGAGLALTVLLSQPAHCCTTTQNQPSRHAHARANTKNTPMHA